jgi:hypothetical protein
LELRLLEFIARPFGTEENEVRRCAWTAKCVKEVARANKAVSIMGTWINEVGRAFR